MLLAAPSTVSTVQHRAKQPVVASQTVGIRTESLPNGGAATWQTERDIRLAGAPTGLGVFAAYEDALAAARQLSVGAQPGLAIMAFRGGFRLHDVQTVSSTFVTYSEDVAGRQPVSRKLLTSSVVPFSAGNLRFAGPMTSYTPAVERMTKLLALVDGQVVIRRHPSLTWAGQPQLTKSTQ